MPGSGPSHALPREDDLVVLHTNSGVPVKQSLALFIFIFIFARNKFDLLFSYSCHSPSVPRPLLPVILAPSRDLEEDRPAFRSLADRLVYPEVANTLQLEEITLLQNG